MTTDGPASADHPTPPTVPVRAPGNRVPGGLLVALVVAALMLLGVIGLVAAALLGDDDPTGAGLAPQVNVDEPATAPPGEPSAGDGSAPPASDSAVDSAAAEQPSGEPAAASPSGDDDFSDDQNDVAPSITTLPGVEAIEPPDGDDLPEPADGPVVLPVQVTTPVAPSTFPPVGFADVGAGSVPALDGWSEHDRRADHLAFVRDDELVELFVIDGVATADAALAAFFDDVGSGHDEVTRSPVTRLGAPSARFLSVAGSEFAATSARQQRTSTMSGTVLAAVRADGTGVVLATSRAGASSVDELAADADLLTAILAHL